MNNIADLSAQLSIIFSESGTNLNSTLDNVPHRVAQQLLKGLTVQLPAMRLEGGVRIETFFFF